jgi:hypothetical protein
MKISKMFCAKNIKPLTPDAPYWDFYSNAFCVKMCGYKEDSIIEVTVQESEEFPECYWGWWDNERQEFAFVYPQKFLVEMCFPYNIKGYEERGEGKLMPVEILENI